MLAGAKDSIAEDDLMTVMDGNRSGPSLDGGNVPLPGIQTLPGIK